MKEVVLLRKVPLCLMVAVSIYLGMTLDGYDSKAYADEPTETGSDFDLGRVLGNLLASGPLGDDPTLTAAYLPSELVPRYYEAPRGAQAVRPAALQPVRRIDLIGVAAVRRVAVDPAEPEPALVKLANWDRVVASLSPVRAISGQSGPTLAEAIADAQWRKSVVQKLRNRK